ncbi:hypothetical protein TuanDB_23320 [Bacillus anthracis]|uniref:Uncharacterized protein n=1 Tax=Bacillus anthracis TaxID=1392 RepID=A0A640L7U4_BACAN|nr:hypothetical protein TuanDB_23320 [Bacillus anthracis]
MAVVLVAVARVTTVLAAVALKAEIVLKVIAVLREEMALKVVM